MLHFKTHTIEKHNRAAEVSLWTQITLYETEQKQSRRLVAASVHGQQDIPRSVEAAEAETVDELRQLKEGRKMKFFEITAGGNLRCAAISAEAQTVAV